MIQGFGLMTTMYGKCGSPKISHFAPQYYSRKIYFYSRFISCLRKIVIVYCVTKVLVGCILVKIPGANDCKEICAATKEESQLFNSSEMQAWISLKNLVLDINASNTFQVEVSLQPASKK